MGAQTTLVQHLSHTTTQKILALLLALVLVPESLACQKLQQNQTSAVLFSWLSVHKLLPKKLLCFFRSESGLSLSRIGGIGW